MKNNHHYVDNEAFHQALIDYNKKLTARREENKVLASQGLKEKPLPQISESIGRCILDIAKGVASMRNFANYPFKEEMISDAVENCILYIESFDVSRTNPFAYFTQCITFAFIRRIEKEHKQLYTKLKILSSRITNEELANYQDTDTTNTELRPSWEKDDFSSNFIRDYELRQQKKKDKLRINQARKKQMLESELDDETEE